MIWRWATRRHPIKKIKWIKEKYFKTVQKSKWNFFGTINYKDTRKEIVLFNTNTVRIERHIKIKGDANPYAPEWSAYFKDRDKRSMNKTLADKKHVTFLWDRQNGICPVCKGEITIETGWQNQHQNWKINGGKDTSENGMLLHQTCHM